MNIEKALAIHGWMNEGELMWLANAASHCKTIAEVGCWQGRVTRAMADNSNAFIFSVDTWKGSQEEVHIKHFADHAENPNWLYEAWLENLKEYVLSTRDAAVVPMQMDSLIAARDFAARHATFDMIFIDAGHDYDSVSADIKAWRPLLAPGGLFCGHDRNNPGVVRALASLAPNARPAPVGTIWYVEPRA